MVLDTIVCIDLTPQPQSTKLREHLWAYSGLKSYTRIAKRLSRCNLLKQVQYDPKLVHYTELRKIYFPHHDHTQGPISEQVELLQGLLIPEDAAFVSYNVALGENLALLPCEGPLRERAFAGPWQHSLYDTQSTLSVREYKSAYTDTYAFTILLLPPATHIQHSSFQPCFEEHYLEW